MKRNNTKYQYDGTSNPRKTIPRSQKSHLEVDRPKPAHIRNVQIKANRATAKKIEVIELFGQKLLLQESETMS